MSAHPKASVPPPRSHNPPRHPQPKVSTTSLIELGLILVTYAFALVAPYLVVPPATPDPPPGELAAAVGLTLLGVAVALTIAMLAFRRTRNYSWLIIGGVPSITLVMGAAILAGAKVG